MARIVANARQGYCLGVILIGLACFPTRQPIANAGELPALGANRDGISVSGISSGAYMAGQFQIAHAKKVAGAAIIAGGPYGCAQSALSGFLAGPGEAMFNLARAVNGCMLNGLALWGIPNASNLADKARKLAAEGAIDPIEALHDDKVYLFSGREDRTVVPAIVRAAAKFYVELGLAADNVRLVSNYDAGHAFVTEESGAACDRSGEPFIVDCDYDQAGDLLAHIYGPLNPPSVARGGSFRAFDQNTFRQNKTSNGLSDDGVVYVPTACQAEPGCRIHIAFHGCAQSRDQVGNTFIEESGFARWADTNRLIVLFPQVAASALNPQACWDWWGYTGDGFLTRTAPQIASVNRMAERLGESGLPGQE